MEGKTILITGSSRGMGAAVARLASSRGARVIVHGNTETKELKKLAGNLGAEYLYCDVSDKKAVIKAVDSIMPIVKRIDSLINCAGIVVPKPFLEADDDNWLSQYRVNLLGTVHFVQAVVPYMKKSKYGRIVNVSSIRGDSVGTSNRVMAYSASKAAVINLTAALAKEYAPDIAVNAVSPGFTMTGMSKTWNDTVWIQVKSSLLGRAAKPEELAEVMLFLAGDKSSFITGQTLVVDGGYEIAGK